MAICMAIQTVLCISGAIAAYVAWSRASAALTEAKSATETQLAELRGHVERITSRLDDVADAFVRTTATVDGVVSDVRGTVGTVTSSVGSVASAVSAPRAALAIGLLKGVQMWRKRRAEQRMAAAVTSEM